MKQLIMPKIDSKFSDLCNNLPLVDVFEYVCTKGSITLNDNEFVYFLDENYRMDITRGYRFGNLTPDYHTFIHNGLEVMKIITFENNSIFCKDYNKVIDSIIKLIQRIVKMLDQRKPLNYQRKKEWFLNMLDKPANSFAEAMQRILFINQIMWQTDHRLIGIGNIDMLLSDYYDRDIASGEVTKDEVYSLVLCFYHTLHDYYKYKSNMLLGDTGQILVLGKTNENGEYQYNDLTILFIKGIEKLQLPDPKILLRVNKDTPREIMQVALQCMSTGVGAPLLSNDDLIIPKLVEFGIPIKDAVNYMTSACWEPLIGGKSSSLNNMTTLNFMKGLDYLFKRENLELIHSFEMLMARYLAFLGMNLNAVKRVVANARFQYDPILSVFIQGPRDKKQDVSCGGAHYMHAGITTVGLSNVINALLNIKEWVFEKKEFTLLDIKVLLMTDYETNSELPFILKERTIRYGMDDEEVIELTNQIIRYTTEQTKDFRTHLGGKLKFGLSAPSYIDAAKGFPASFDGRKLGDPFNVHISNEQATSYLEVLNFASALDYGQNRFNGNVIDLMVSPSFISNNFDKFLDIIQISIKKGIFQMQINVVGSDTLIAAKTRPEDYPNLIVRVWGFSAYFKDLPTEYQDVLLERALRNEGKSA